MKHDIVKTTIVAMMAAGVIALNGCASGQLVKAPSLNAPQTSEVSEAIQEESESLYSVESDDVDDGITSSETSMDAEGVGLDQQTRISNSGIYYRENNALYDLDGTMVLSEEGKDYVISGPLSEDKIFVMWKSQDVEHDEYWDRDTVTNETLNCGFVNKNGELVVDLSDLPAKLDDEIEGVRYPEAGSYYHDGVAYIKFYNHFAFVDDAGNVLLGSKDFDEYTEETGKLRDWEFYGKPGSVGLEAASWSDGLTHDGYLKLMKLGDGGRIVSVGLFDLKNGKMAKQLDVENLGMLHEEGLGDKYLLFSRLGEDHKSSLALDWDGNTVFDSDTLVGERFDELEFDLDYGINANINDADSMLAPLCGTKTFADGTQGRQVGVFDFVKGDWAVGPEDTSKENAKIPVMVYGEYAVMKQQGEGSSFNYFVVDRDNNVKFENSRSCPVRYQGDWWIISDSDESETYIANIKTGERQKIWDSYIDYGPGAAAMWDGLEDLE